MDINGVHIDKSMDDEGNIIMGIEDKQYLISPDTVAQAWLIHRSKNYDKLKANEEWTRKVRSYIQTTHHNVFLIALLLSVK